MFYDNYVKLCNNVNKAPSAVAEALGLSRASVNGWKHGKVPTDATLHKIADYFDISIDDLLESKKEKPAPTTEDGLDDVTLEIMKVVKQLSVERQRVVLAQIKALEQMKE